jgi:hypothetical protein
MKPMNTAGICTPMMRRRDPRGAESTSTAWLVGPEDLYFEHRTGRIWTPAEFPNLRDIVSIPLPGL